MCFWHNKECDASIKKLWKSCQKSPSSASSNLCWGVRSKFHLWVWKSPSKLSKSVIVCCVSHQDTYAHFMNIEIIKEQGEDLFHIQVPFLIWIIKSQVLESLLMIVSQKKTCSIKFLVVLFDQRIVNVYYLNTVIMVVIWNAMTLPLHL